MERGEILNLNWNRASMISKIPNMNRHLRAELTMRIQLQNAFSCSKTDKEREETIKTISETLDKETIKAVRSYLKKM